MLGWTIVDLLRLTRRRRWPAERVQQWQSSWLRQRVQDAYAHTDYYRELFDRAGIRPEDIRGLEDLGRIPISTKVGRRRYPLEALVQRGAKLNRCVRTATSGSTGVPTTVIFSRREAARRDADFARARLDAGGRLWDRLLSIRSPRAKTTQWTDLFRNPFDYFWNRSCHLTEAVDVMRRYRPDVVWGFPSRLYLVAREIERRGMRDLRPRLIFSSGEVLDPAARAFQERIFGCPIRMFYATWEFGVIAAPCLAGQGYHVSTDHVVVECVRNGQPVRSGEQGELVITRLTSEVMPFLRYATGDLARVGEGPCPCGHRGLHILSIDGRTEDIFVLPDGSPVCADVVAEPFREIACFLQFRVIQEALGVFRIEYVADRPAEEAEVGRVRSYFQAHLGASLVHVERVQEIPVAPSGKIRRFVSYVNPSSARMAIDEGLSNR